MNNRPTPETDSYANRDWWTLFRANEHARELERERDEAREKAERYRLEANSLMLQRDEARESLKHIGEYGTEEINAAVELRQKLASALVERDEALMDRANGDIATMTINHYERLLRERDEARERIERQRLEIVRLNGATNHAGGTPLKIALRERDEAREELEEYRSIAENIGAKKAVSEKEKAIRERDEWAAMCGRYKQERDEVKEKYRWAVIHWQIGSAKMERERDEWKNKAYSHATDYTLMEAKCFRLEQQLKEYDKLKS